MRPRPQFKHVRQLDRSGCGIACAAMLAGVDYSDARKAWVGFSKRREQRLQALGGGLRRDEINALLLRLGCTQGAHGSVRLVDVWPGIGGHWIVVDEKGWIYDPGRQAYQTEQQAQKETHKSTRMKSKPKTKKAKSIPTKAKKPAKPTPAPLEEAKPVETGDRCERCGRPTDSIMLVGGSYVCEGCLEAAEEERAAERENFW